MRQLNRWALPSGLVITCRTAEYANLVMQTGKPLASAAVVELSPVSESDAIRFIKSGTISGDNRWEPVSENIMRHPDSPVARVLSTPLMLVLARDAYSSSATDPADLLRFADRASLERDLLENFYRSRLQSGLPLWGVGRAQMADFRRTWYGRGWHAGYRMVEARKKGI